MRFFFIIVFFVIVNYNASASHIVGGEINLKRLTGYNYEISLVMYFDKVNGNPAAKDNVISLTTFDKKTNRLLDVFYIDLTDSLLLVPSPGICEYINVQTKVYRYIETVILDSSKYSGSEGFYIAWERCCRNGNIVNIEIPNETGVTFYTEAPPLNLYINSNPIFKTPDKNGYSCVNADFVYDFGANDADNDSLTYELITPLRGHTSTNNPGNNNAFPAPYDLVSYNPGYSLNVMIPGKIPLMINSKTGVLSLNAKSAGIHVFGVICKEYRNGVYLGSVRRDYQLSVISCVKNNRPVLEAINPATNNNYQAGDTISLNYASRSCIEINGIDTTQGQKLTLSIVGIPLSQQELSDILSIDPQSHTTLVSHDTARFSLCFEGCRRNTLYNASLILKNENNCKIPAYDTLPVVFDNRKTSSLKILTGLPGNMVTATEGENLILNITVLGSANDMFVSLTHSSNLSGFNNYGSATNRGKAVYRFEYIPKCSDGINAPYKIAFNAGGSSSCTTRLTVQETITLYIKSKDIGYKYPTVTTDIDSLYSIKIGEIINGKITVSGVNSHHVKLKAIPKISGLELTNASGIGKFQSSFSFTANCENIKNVPNKITLIAVDSNCYLKQYDTLVISAFVRDTTLKPEIITDLSNENEYSLKIGASISSNITALGIYNHQIRLALKDNDIPGLSFKDTSGMGTSTSPFIFRSLCENLRTTPYDLTFIASDSTCTLNLYDTLKVKIAVRDTVAKEFYLNNIFTPNNDGVNDALELPGLPPDNCAGQFILFEVYNRWGKHIYTSDDPRFRWEATNIPDGLYYYVAKYTNTDFKSWVMVVR